MLRRVARRDVARVVFLVGLGNVLAASPSRSVVFFAVIYPSLNIAGMFAPSVAVMRLGWQAISSGHVSRVARNRPWVFLLVLLISMCSSDMCSSPGRFVGPVLSVVDGLRVRPSLRKGFFCYDEQRSEHPFLFVPEGVFRDPGKDDLVSGEISEEQDHGKEDRAFSEILEALDFTGVGREPDIVFQVENGGDLCDGEEDAEGERLWQAKKVLSKLVEPCQGSQAVFVITDASKGNAIAELAVKRATESGLRTLVIGCAAGLRFLDKDGEMVQVADGLSNELLAVAALLEHSALLSQDVGSRIRITLSPPGSSRRNTSRQTVTEFGPLLVDCDIALMFARAEDRDTFCKYLWRYVSTVRLIGGDLVDPPVKSEVQTGGQATRSCECNGRRTARDSARRHWRP